MKLERFRSLRLITQTGAFALFLLPLAHAQSAGTPAEKPAAKTSASAAAPNSKPAAKPAGANPANSAAGGKEGRTAGGERLMTREELRSCLNRSDELVSRRQSIEREDAALIEERKALDAQAEELRRAQETVRTDSEQKQQAFKLRAEQLSARVTAFNTKTAEDKTSRSRPPGRPELEALERERVQLDSDIKALNADRDAIIKEIEQRSQAHNARVNERDQKIAAFTERHRQYKGVVEGHEAEAQAWKRECGDRPYREDDEKAIRAGK